MPSADPPEHWDRPSSPQPLTKLPFPPVTKSHILHCSYHYWQPKYRSISPKARLIPLAKPFLDYLRADGIVLPSEPNTKDSKDDFSEDFSPEEQEDDEEEQDPSIQWQEIHSQIRSTIAELGGKITPKLNWSAPKDATWISATNDMECRSPNDVYLLLKSSDFITHDLEHAFDDTEEEHGKPSPNAQDPKEVTQTETQPSDSIPYHLVLRKYFQVNPSLEFRCFVRNRKLLCVCQRDLNHFEFLFNLRDQFRDKISDFFNEHLRDSFPDRNFVFDVYIPSPHSRIWLIDINPWTPRTDPLLFSWLEILNMKDEPDFDTSELRLPLVGGETGATEGPSDSTSESEGEVEEVFEPEFRLVERDDPEAYSFSTPQYSAHKLPREVVDASKSEGGLREFVGQWQDVLARRIQEDQDGESD